MITWLGQKICDHTKENLVHVEMTYFNKKKSHKIICGLCNKTIVPEYEYEAMIEILKVNGNPKP